MIAPSVMLFFFFQAEDGIRDLVRSRGLGDVYKRQGDERKADRDDQPDFVEQVIVECDPDRCDRGEQDLSLIHI